MPHLASIAAAIISERRTTSSFATSPEVVTLPTNRQRALRTNLWHNRPSMFHGLVLRLVLISVGISLPTRTG